MKQPRSSQLINMDSHQLLEKPGRSRERKRAHGISRTLKSREKDLNNYRLTYLMQIAPKKGMFRMKLILMKHLYKYNINTANNVVL